MGPLQQGSRCVMFIALLLGASACSDNRDAAEIGQGIGSGADAAEQKPERSSDAVGRRLTARIKDVVISAKVKRMILRERALKISDIGVTTHNRVVILTGTVEKPEDARRAIQIAQSVNDVDSVDNRLAVRSGG
jgi:osmotically-inducible protein OsmY